MNLSEISFPVYVLGHEKPTTDNGVVYYFRNNKLKIVDDTNIQLPTLAARRLQVKRDGGLLQDIKAAIFFLGDFIKISKPSIWFIDSNGNIFNHKKSATMSLIFREITSVMPTNSGYVIEVKGIGSRFKCLYAPKDKTYAGILKSGSSYILYGLYDKEYKETVRKI